MSTITKFDDVVEPGQYKSVLLTGDLDNVPSGDYFKSPCIIRSPVFSDNTYLLFNDQSGNIWSVPITEEGEVTGTESKVIDGQAEGLGLIKAFEATRDTENEEWIFTGSSEGDGWIFRATESDNSWTVQTSQDQFLTGVGDRGISGYWGEDDQFLLVARSDADNGALDLYEISDFVTNRAPASPDVGPIRVIESMDQTLNFGKMQFFQTVRGDPIILAEGQSTGSWTTQQYVMTPPSKNGLSTMAEDPGAVQTTHPVIERVNYMGSSGFTHPYYTTELGRPMVFGQRVMKKNGGTKQGIYVAEPAIGLSDTRDLHPLRARLLKGTTAAATSMWVPTYGADTLVVGLRETNSRTVTLNESVSYGDALELGSYYSNRTESTTAGDYVFTWDDPAPYISISVDGEVNRLDIELR